jgi:hypothetical protein
VLCYKVVARRVVQDEEARGVPEGDKVRLAGEEVDEQEIGRAYTLQMSTYV